MKRLNGKTHKILLIGDISKAFLDAGDIAKFYEVHSDMPDGITVAAKNNFTGIGVVMAGTSGKLRSALKALREANRDAKIILLARMCEEPAARQLVRGTYDGRSLADDYLICPIHLSYLESYMSHLVGDRPGVSQGVAVKGEIGLATTIDTRTKRKIELLEKLATEDDLTGLKNRRYIWEFSRQIIEYAKKENVRVTLLVFDVDNLKQYNDIYGHQAGDEILKQAAVLMRHCCRGHDVVGRIGGDEFAVIFWDDPQQKRAAAAAKSQERRSANADHPSEAITIAKRFVKELGKAGFSSFGGLGPEGKGVLTISGGLASFPRDGQTIEQLFEQADKALLEAKRSGKNRIYLVGKPQNNITDIEE